MEVLVVQEVFALTQALEIDRGLFSPLCVPQCGYAMKLLGVLVQWNDIVQWFSNLGSGPQLGSPNYFVESQDYLFLQ